MQMGFYLYQLMSGLMPTLGKGTHAFHPSNQTWGASSAVSTMVPKPLSDNEVLHLALMIYHLFTANSTYLRTIDHDFVYHQAEILSNGS